MYRAGSGTYFRKTMPNVAISESVPALVNSLESRRGNGGVAFVNYQNPTFLGERTGGTDMAEGRLKELTPADMTPEQKRVAESIQSGPRGSGLRGPFNALLRSPDLCDVVQKVGAYIRFNSSIPAKLNELAIIVTGRHWTAQYEFYAHRKLALEAGLKPAIADAVAEGRRPEGMDADETIVYDFATSLMKTGEVSDALYKRAADRFGERGVMDLTGACGYYSIVSMVLNVAQVPLPAGEKPPLRKL